MGVSALFSSKKSGNTGIGAYCGYATTTGTQNVFLGDSSGYSNTTGSQNTSLGYNAGPSSSNRSNTIAIGYLATLNASNTTVIGNSSMGSIGGYTSWSNLSDGRFKKNVKEDVKGLDFIMKLRPVTYNLDVTKLNDFLGVKETSEEGQQAIKAKEQMIQSGFIAQEVEKAAGDVGYDFSGVDKPKNDKDHYALRYAEFVVPIVKSIQEQQSVITDLQAKNTELQSNNSALAQKNTELESKLNSIDELLKQVRDAQIACCRAQGNLEAAATLDIPVLEQNNPNPFTDNTTIRYYLPSNITSASITISDVSGKVMNTFKQLGTGNGQIMINASVLAAGTYYYNLIVNGTQVDSKKMILVK